MVAVKLDRHSKLSSDNTSILAKGTGGADGVGAAFSVGDWIYVNSSGNIRWADSSVGTPNPTIGVVYRVWENYLVVITSGNVTIDSWSLTTGSEYFLGTNGAMTTIAPTANGTIVQSIGRAVSTTEFAINLLDYLET